MELENNLNNLVGLIVEYGPWIYGLLFAYCALKSGALPLFAGYGAQAGLLDLTPVVVASFAGGYLGDEVRFFLARRYGDGWAQNRPRIRRAIATTQALVERYGWLYIFLYRYPKGMRTIGAIPVGLGRMRWVIFTTLNAASAALWAAILVGVGYLFGAQVERAVANGWGAASVGLLLIMASAIAFAWWKVRRAGPTL